MYCSKGNLAAIVSSDDLDGGDGNVDNSSKPKGVLSTQKHFILPIMSH